MRSDDEEVSSTRRTSRTGRVPNGGSGPFQISLKSVNRRSKSDFSREYQGEARGKDEEQGNRSGLIEFKRGINHVYTMYKPCILGTNPFSHGLITNKPMAKLPNGPGVEAGVSDVFTWYSWYSSYNL